MFKRVQGGGGGDGDPFSNPLYLFKQVFANMYDWHNWQGMHDRYNRKHGRQSQSQNSCSGGGSCWWDPFSHLFFGGIGDMMGGMVRFEDTMQQGGSCGKGFSSFRSSSSLGFGGGGGNWQSVSTTTQLIDEKKVTCTKQTTLQPDRAMKTTIETSGDENLQQALENSRMETGDGYQRQLQNSGQSQKNSNLWWRGNQR